MKNLLLPIFPIAICAVLLSVINVKEPDRSPTTALYSPSEAANRLHAALFMRYGPDKKWHGEDRVDPLFWGTTTHLVLGESHQKAIIALDAFLESPDAVAKLSPPQRALLQNDLWRLFNWINTPSSSHPDGPSGSDPAGAEQLKQRFGRAIAALSLTKDQIDQLPDNLQSTALEGTENLPNFDAADSGWVALAALDDRPVTPAHRQQFQGRSTFTAYLRLPKGRAETVTFLKQLTDHATSTASKEGGDIREHKTWLNSFPEAPLGTSFALVRRLVVIDDGGNPIPTAIAQTVQMRTLVSADSPRSYRSHPPQEFRLYTLTRSPLFLGKPSSLRLVGPDERAFSFFLVPDNDQFPLPPDKESPSITRHTQWPIFAYDCFQCHISAPGKGLLTMNSFIQLFAPDRSPRAFPTRFTERTRPDTSESIKSDLPPKAWAELRLWLNSQSAPAPLAE